MIIEVLKQFTYVALINSPMLKVAEFKGEEIVQMIFEELQGNGFKLLPSDFREKYEQTDDPSQKIRIRCDFVAGMTDRYALEFYGRLKSINPQTIFKPL